MRALTLLPLVFVPLAGQGAREEESDGNVVHPKPPEGVLVGPRSTELQPLVPGAIHAAQTALDINPEWSDRVVDQMTKSEGNPNPMDDLGYGNMGAQNQIQGNQDGLQY